MSPRAVRGWDEQDAYTGWRRYLHWQRGELRKVKRRTHHRERREGKAEAARQEQEREVNTLTLFPHCDAEVLHAPGACRYCDLHPEWQQLRQHWGIAFTGQPPGDGLPCPSDYHRGQGGAHVWPGNTPQ